MWRFRELSEDVGPSAATVNYLSRKASVIASALKIDNTVPRLDPPLEATGSAALFPESALQRFWTQRQLRSLRVVGKLYRDERAGVRRMLGDGRQINCRSLLRSSACLLWPTSCRYAGDTCRTDRLNAPRKAFTS
jgi:hypothetical protein